MSLATEAADRLKDRLRPYLAEDEALALYCAALARPTQRLQEALRWDDAGSGVRRAMDPRRCPPWALAWLAQFAGTDITTVADAYGPSVPSTPYDDSAGIGEDAYLIADHQGFFIVSSTGAPGGTVAELRLRIADNPYRYRGTPGAMLAAAQLHLTGTQTVYLMERFGDADHVSIATLTAETPDAPAVLAACMAAKPVGLLLTHTVIVGGTYSDVLATFPTYTAVKAARADYAALFIDPTA